MADILLSSDRFSKLSSSAKAVASIDVGPHRDCDIYGIENTFCIIHEGEDAIASIGYVCDINLKSMRETLLHILRVFQESQIRHLKENLIGQYVMLIKKGNKVYLFSDFMGVRNVFYSSDGKLISSSYSILEDILLTSSADLVSFKVLEFLAMRHIFYPAWLGRKTGHRKIDWLLPYEYIVINTDDSSFRLGSIIYEINNEKQNDCDLLAKELLSIMEKVVYREEFSDSIVATSLTGGRDSRLVAAVAANKYRRVRFRTSFSKSASNSTKDLRVASKISVSQNVPLDIYEFRSERDEDRFYSLTEGFAPSTNQDITPLIDNTGSYSLGLGGVFGTELFLPLPWNSIDEFLEIKLRNTTTSLKTDMSFLKYFRDSLYSEFQNIKDHFKLSNEDERDYLRLFIIFNTARFGSFILSSYNQSGLQLEPYGNYGVLRLALSVDPSLWGNHKSLVGNALVQSAAMAKLNPQIAKIMTYSSFRPMIPFSLASAPSYVFGFTLQVAHWLKEQVARKIQGSKRTNLPNGYYLSNGWEAPFIRRSVEKYGLSAQTFF